MKKANRIIILWALVCIFLLWGCSDILKESVNFELPENKGLVLVIINGSDGAGRTLLPKAPDFVRYDLVFTKGAAEESYPDWKTTDVISLNVGEWALELTAYVAGAALPLAAAKGNATVTVSPSAPATVNVSLYALTGGQGTLSYNITLPTDLSSAQMIVSPFAGGSDQTVDLLLSGASGSLPLASGDYRLTLTLNKDGLPAGKTVALQIYDNLVTEATYEFKDADFSSAVTISGPVPTKTGYTVTEIYIYSSAGQKIDAAVGGINTAKTAWSFTVPSGYESVYFKVEVCKDGTLAPKFLSKPIALDQLQSHDGEGAIALDFTYAITIPTSLSGGSVTAVPVEAFEGQTVTLTMHPDSGKQFKGGSLKYKGITQEKGVILETQTVSGDETASFVMPAEDVGIAAEFKTPLTAGLFKKNAAESLEEITGDYTTHSLANALSYIKTSASVSPGDRFVIILGETTNATLSPASSTGDSTGYLSKAVTVTLQGSGAAREVSLDNSGSLFVVGNNAELILGDKIILQGRNSNGYSLVRVEGTGKLTMQSGSEIKGNKTSASVSGGGVSVTSGGTFTMDGGTISGNYAASNGGGVYVTSGGTFTMNGGTISDNTHNASSSFSGGGVFVETAGETTSKFFMNGGAINRNTSSSRGGGVSVLSGTFTMTGGTISGNISATAAISASSGGGVSVSGGTFIMDGGTISGNTASATDSSATTSGGGVSVSGGTFTMNDGTISGNTTTTTTYSTSSGGGVSVSSGAFVMTGGTISGNTATSPNDNNPAAYGGGVNISGGAFEMTGGAIIGNATTSSPTSPSIKINGGGVYVSGGTFTMKDGLISANTAPFGGGVYVSGGTTKFVEKASLSANIAEEGGGVYVSGGSFTLAGGAINGNIANGGSYSRGGGVYVKTGIFTISDGTLDNNSAIASVASYGGGVYVGGGTVNMTKGTITANISSCESYSYGGGVYLDGGKFTISGGTFSNNTASSLTPSYSRGGGVYVYTGTFEMAELGRIDTNNLVCIEPGKWITLTKPFTGAGPIALIDLSGSSSSWLPPIKVLKKETSFGTQDIPLDRFLLGDFVIGPQRKSIEAMGYFLNTDGTLQSW
ncbi:putative extracellular nuclease [Treponema primitia ZAS-2]|uniref:Putative extracellular nuclease n=1 Tax=Treponema primitia (strain ATCC BAA-887 / DSM 12427 / ZAS-2) TaxID=545694 RepID=F5YLQ9_TREPZ|nr:hypothetical protein [Treponema primitia]AEF86376.1 putative extracellular nuclease [Treponema primitia ZAS-2]